MKTDLRILLIDDEVQIRELLRLSLTAKGFQVAESETGEKGLAKAAEFHPHLVILDLGLPAQSGFQVLQSLRKWTQVPVIVLTVNDDEQTKVELLDAGADDYLTKPFSVPELMARVRVALRTHGMIEATPIFKSGTLEVDLNQKQIQVGGKVLKLSQTEFALLALLVREQGRVVPQAQLLRQVWGDAAVEQVHYLRIYINQLRKKIEANPSDPKHIVTEPGVGYRLI